MNLLGQIIYLWFVSTLLGSITFPLLFFISPNLKDRGYSISKIMGLVLVTYISWMLSSLKLLPFSSASVVLAAVFLAAISFWAGFKKRGEILAFLKENRNLILVMEILFVVALVIFLLIISLNPHIDPDSERFMDYALLNSIDRTDYFPPLDPWFAGKTMNYYYYGYIIIAALHKLVTIPLPLFFNLALGLIYALFTLTCFGIGYNLTGRKSYGLLAVVALMLIGNLDGFIQIRNGIVKALDLSHGNLGAFLQIMSEKFKAFDFFHGARVLVQKSADGSILDYPINEFPFFSLMWGDLHAYVIAFPLNMAVLSLILNLALTSPPRLKRLGEKAFEWILFLAVFSLALGALFGTNTWDYPIYLVMAVSVVTFNHLKAEGEFWKKVLHFLPLALTLFVLSFFLYLPFNLDFIKEQAAQGRGGIGLVPVRSPLGLFLVAFGIYLFFLLVFIFSRQQDLSPGVKKNLFGGPLIIFILAILFIISWIGQTYIFLLIPLLLLLFLLFSPLKTGEHFPLILALAALGLATICEFFFLKDHYLGGGYDRMNTVFKIYTNVWLFLGVASIYFIFYINQLLQEREGLKLFWQTAVFIILFLGFFYTTGALGSRIRGRRQPLTLDGAAYIHQPVPPNYKKEWRWDLDDWKATQWMEDNIKGRPVILEAVGNAYDWASRISTFTGLPTLVGWVNHEAGWRNDWTEPGRRNRDTQTLYSTTNLNTALYLINKYSINYIYIGKLEREQYPEKSLSKFGQIGELVYQEGPVEIYKVGL